MKKQIKNHLGIFTFKEFILPPKMIIAVKFSKESYNQTTLEPVLRHAIA